MSTAALHGLRRWWDRLTVYLPIMLMAVLAMLSYWLVRTAPPLLDAPAQTAPSHVPDYQMSDFTVRVFDGEGRLKSELSGRQGRHFPDTDTVEVDGVRVRSLHPSGRVTTAQAERGLSNGDGSEVQLIGHHGIRHGGDLAAGQRADQHDLAAARRGLDRGGLVRHGDAREVLDLLRHGLRSP